MLYKHQEVAIVSIHAPVRERPSPVRLSSSYSCFNSRSREGATIHRICDSLAYSVSIHAPVRERHIFDELRLYKHGFNSRSREGATPLFRRSSCF